MHNLNAQKEDDYEAKQERDAAIGFAKMLTNYIQKDGLNYEWLGLSDCLTDFINDMENP